MIETCQHNVYNNREQKKKEMIDEFKYYLLMFVRNDQAQLHDRKKKFPRSDRVYFSLFSIPKYEEEKKLSFLISFDESMTI